jgi:predicted permease
MITVISQMAVLFTLIAVGYIAKKVGLMDKNFNTKLSALVIQIACPSLVLTSVMGDRSPNKSLIIPLLLIGLATHTVLSLAGWIVPKMFCHTPDRRGIYGFMIAFGNIGFIGYPVVASLFGKYAVFYASILMLPYTVFAFTVGTSMVSGRRERINMRLFLSPIMVASILAIVIVSTGFNRFPFILTRSLTLIGDITIPLALLIIGASLADVSMKGLWNKKSLYLISAFRMLVAPLCIYYAASLTGLNGSINTINTLLTAMPVSTYGTMFCYRYGKDDALMTQGICLSTILSILTIPVIVRLIS